MDISSIPPEITVVLIPDSSLFISYGSARFSGNPAEELTITAVTGTNGKTTVSHFIGQLLEATGCKTAVIGTTGVYVRGRLAESVPDMMTTMPAELLDPILRRCIDRGITHIVMEASSIGLSSNRLAHCPVSVGVLLNIGIDHYEEHGGRQPYIDAKRRLTVLAEKMVINEDDPVCRQVGEEMAGQPLYFSSSQINGHLLQAALPVPGKHNEMNARAAICAMLGLGFSMDEIIPYLGVLRLPKGRLEKYRQNGIDVYIDYAHTPDALRAVLEALREQDGARVITVFGCGGDRDREKRPQMGAVAAQYSSHVILTSDNPRTEDPAQIIIDILAGTTGFPVPVDVLLNRRYAIQYAIKEAQYGDIVLVAGKGHEQTQQIGGEIFHFCDMEEVKRAFM